MPEPQLPAMPSSPAPRRGMFAYLGSNLKWIGLIGLACAFTVSLAVYNLSHGTRRKKRPVVLTPAQAAAQERDEADALGADRSVALVKANPALAAAQTAKANKSSADPEFAKIDKQLDELTESIDSFTPTRAAPKPPSEAAPPPPKSSLGSFGALSGMREDDGARAAPRLKGNSGMAGGVGRSFDNLQFQSRQQEALRKAKEARNAKDGISAAAPMLSGALGQAKALSKGGVEVPAAEIAAKAPEEDPEPFGFGPQWLRNGGKRVQQWVKRSSSAEWGRIFGFIWTADPKQPGAAPPKMNLLGRAFYKFKGPQERGLNLPDQGVAVRGRAAAPAAPEFTPAPASAAPTAAAPAPTKKIFPRRKFDRRGAYAVVGAGAALALTLHLGVGGILPKVQPRLAKGSLGLIAVGAGLTALGFPKTGMASVATGSALFALDKKLAAKIAGPAG